MATAAENCRLGSVKAAKGTKVDEVNKDGRKNLGKSGKCALAFIKQEMLDFPYHVFSVLNCMSLFS